MNLNELHAGISTALTQALDGPRLRSLAVEAERMGDMTSWAIGQIDPKGQICAAFEVLKLQARVRYEETQNVDLAQLHDSIAVLLNAIATHDDDLRPDGIGASQLDD